jgi:SAM-dependent methyltransferase
MDDIIAKTREDYNRIAELYAQTRNAARELKQFQNMVQKGQVILDWGCGNGRLVYLLQDKQVIYYGTDQSCEMIRVAGEQFKKEVDAGWAHFICTEDKEADFTENFFDIVFMIASFHHLPDEESRKKLLQRIFQELKPGGKLIMTNWNLESDWAEESLQKDWQKIDEYDYLIPWKSQAGEILVKRFYHHFTPDALQSIFVETGFKIEDSYYARGIERVDKKQGKNLVVVAYKP